MGYKIVILAVQGWPRAVGRCYVKGAVPWAAALVAGQDGFWHGTCMVDGTLVAVGAFFLLGKERENQAN